jgi:hypothetical protein
MKTLSTLALAAAFATLATSCTHTHTHTATTRTATTVAATDEATPEERRIIARRSYSQRDMQKTGRTDVGSQLEALDPAVTVSGRR